MLIYETIFWKDELTDLKIKIPIFEIKCFINYLDSYKNL